METGSEIKKKGLPGSIQAFVLLMICSAVLAFPISAGPRRSEAPRFTADQFAAIIDRISEKGGYFWNDNYVFNEASYLHPLKKLHDLGIHGGIYIGVGPNQNFTYIAKIKPRYAFIIDIRRQNWLEHLLFKALFHLASDRCHYLSLLLSRPVAPGIFDRDSYTVQDLVGYFETVEADPSLFGSTQSLVRRTLEKNCGLKISEQDWTIIEKIHRAFYSRGMLIKYDYLPVPTYGELLVEKDLDGRMQNFLNSSEEFRYIKQLEEENRIIPIVGDFAGAHAFKELGDYLKERGEKVKVIYASNVEQYLVRNLAWPNFIQNVRGLPLDDRAVFIRTHWGTYIPHPEEVAGYQFTQILQWVKPFLRDVPSNTSISYWQIVTTDTISLK